MKSTYNIIFIIFEKQPEPCEIAAKEVILKLWDKILI